MDYVYVFDLAVNILINIIGTLEGCWDEPRPRNVFDIAVVRLVRTLRVSCVIVIFCFISYEPTHHHKIFRAYTFLIYVKSIIFIHKINIHLYL